MNSMRRCFVLVVGIVLFCIVGCLEVDPLIQGGRKGSLSCVTNAVYHGCAYRDAPWCGGWTAGGDRRHALYSVRAKYNWFYALAAVCTFGAYMPMDLEWRYDLGKGEKVR
jgi:hypothetical protein